MYNNLIPVDFGLISSVAGIINIRMSSHHWRIINEKR